MVISLIKLFGINKSKLIGLYGMERGILPDSLRLPHSSSVAKRMAGLASGNEMFFISKQPSWH